jgi:hypothetical protein
VYLCGLGIWPQECFFTGFHWRNGFPSWP